jgi:hypothetical protein
MRYHPLLCITNFSLGVTGFLYLEQSSYGWEECLSQEVGCTKELKDKCFILLLSYSVSLFVVHELCVFENDSYVDV